MAEKLEKKCSKCKKVKPVSMFYKRYEYNNTYRSNCKECMKVYADKNIVSIRANKNRWKKENQHKVRTHWTVGNHLRSGRLVKKPCAKCGSTKNIHVKNCLEDIVFRYNCPSIMKTNCCTYVRK